MSRVDRYRRAREIFVQAIELAPAERARLLDADCAGDADLRSEVESLLAAHDANTGFDSLARARSTWGRDPPTSGRVPRLEFTRMPERIGHYRILKFISVTNIGNAARL